jgi:hypothetical protein
MVILERYVDLKKELPFPPGGNFRINRRFLQKRGAKESHAPADITAIRPF